MTVVPFTTFRFEVVLDLDQPTPGLDSPLCDASFAECEGLEMSMEPKTVESASVTNAQQHLIGKTKYGQVTLKRGMTSNLQLWQWFSRGTRPGSVLTAHGHITLWDSTGNPALQVNLAGCLPVRMRAPSLNAASGLVAVEELSLVCARMSVGQPGQGMSGIGFAASFGAGAGASFSAAASAGASASVGASASAGFDANASLSASASAGASFSGGIG